MEVRERVKQGVRDHGVPAVKRALGLSRYAVLALATDGAKPHPGTIAQAKANLEALDVLDNAEAH